jgi:hypothetical protein
MSDWKEKELEDYIVANPFELFADYEIVPLSLQIRLLGRQVRCKYGIIDLLYCLSSAEEWRAYPHIYILELKAVQADKKTVEQMERYKAAVNDIDLYKYVPPGDFLHYAHMIDNFMTINTMIVAPSFHESIRWFEIQKLTDRTDAGFTFRKAESSPDGWASNDELEAAMVPALKMATRKSKFWFVSSRMRAGLDSLTFKSPIN